MTSILWNTLKDFGLELDESTILLILSPILTAIFGQGISDHGKER